MYFTASSFEIVGLSYTYFLIYLFLLKKKQKVNIMNFVKIKWYGDWYVFKYDENQNLISKKELVNDAVVSELTYTYDSEYIKIDSEIFKKFNQTEG